MESAADLRDLLTASREPKRRLETNVYTKLGVNTLVTYREETSIQRDLPNLLVKQPLASHIVIKIILGYWG